jgi:hypothetical protein
MQKLDKTHCKALYRFSGQQMPGKRPRYGGALASACTTFGSWKLVMIAGRKGETRPEEVVGTVGMVGRTTRRRRGDERAPILKGT